MHEIYQARRVCFTFCYFFFLCVCSPTKKKFYSIRMCLHAVLVSSPQWRFNSNCSVKLEQEIKHIFLLVPVPVTRLRMPSVVCVWTTKYITVYIIRLQKESKFHNKKPTAVCVCVCVCVCVLGVCEEAKMWVFHSHLITVIFFISCLQMKRPKQLMPKSFLKHVFNNKYSCLKVQLYYQHRWIAS